MRAADIRARLRQGDSPAHVLALIVDYLEEREATADYLAARASESLDTEADAYRKGHEDGFAGLDTGLTYDNDPDSPRSEAYDRGRTAGEALREMDEARKAGTE